MSKSKYRVLNATETIINICYKVQVKKWHGWSTVKSFEGAHRLHGYLEFSANELAESLNSDYEINWRKWESDNDYQLANRIFKPMKVYNDFGIEYIIRIGATEKLEGLFCVEDVCRYVCMGVDEVKDILKTEFSSGKALMYGCKNYYYENVLYMAVDDFDKILKYYVNKNKNK